MDASLMYRVQGERKRIGYWKGPWEDQNLPDPRDFVGPIGPDDADRAFVVQRLKGAATLTSWRGFSTCRICGKGLGTQCRTFDGTWVFPEKFEHYIEEHGLTLPQEFIDHLKGVPENLLKEVQAHRVALRGLQNLSTSVKDCPGTDPDCHRDGEMCRKEFFTSNCCETLLNASLGKTKEEFSRHGQAMRSLMQVPWSI